MDRFRDGTRQNARRIEEDEWEKHKDLILELYETNSVKQVREYMKREHGFIGSHRQFGHRIREVWGVKKYKKDKQKGEETGQRQSKEQPVKGRQLRSAVPSSGAQHPRGDKLPHDQPASSRAAIREPQASKTAGSAPFPSASPARSASIHRPLSFLPQPDSAELDSELRHRWLADMLLALGDPRHAFEIGAALWKVEQANGMQPSQEALVHIVSCVRAARTQEQAVTCREMLNAIDVGVSEDEGSWRTAVNDFLCALTYRCDTDAIACLGQIQDTIDDIVKADEGSRRLEPLTGREGLRFDVPAYTLLSSALDWYNLSTGEEEIDVQAVMQQFVDQQPALLEEPDINFCLPLCLSWCIDELQSGPDIPPIASDARATKVNLTSEVHTVLCALWRTWLDSRLSPSSSSPAWAGDTESQLGIPATQLLYTVVCMMMAAVPQRKETQDASISIAQRALAGAKALKSLDPRELIRRFVVQVQVANQPLMGPPDGEHARIQNSAADVSVLNQFREFVARSLGIEDLPALEEAAVVYPLVLAEP